MARGPGRKQEAPITDALVVELHAKDPATAVAQTFAKRLVELASDPKGGKSGLDALLSVIERTEGRVPIRKEVTGAGGSPLAFEQVGTAAEAQSKLMEILAGIAARNGSAVAPLSNPPRKIRA